jgi:hypothetical protein
LKENAVPICPDTELSFSTVPKCLGAELSWCQAVFFNGCRNVLVPNCLVSDLQVTGNQPALLHTRPI